MQNISRHVGFLAVDVLYSLRNENDEENSSPEEVPRSVKPRCLKIISLEQHSPPLNTTQPPSTLSRWFEPRNLILTNNQAADIETGIWLDY